MYAYISAIFLNIKTGIPCTYEGVGSAGRHGGSAREAGRGTAKQGRQPGRSSHADSQCKQTCGQQKAGSHGKSGREVDGAKPAGMPVGQGRLECKHLGQSNQAGRLGKGRRQNRQHLASR